jgi:hypothetical protein
MFAGILAITAALELAPCFVAAQMERGFLSGEMLTYMKEADGLKEGDRQIYRLSGEIETYRPLTENLNFDLRLYGSANIKDNDGSYFDLNIAKLSYNRGPVRVDLGYDTIYWGVVESRPVVNVINQRDQIRDLEGKLSLGQPMLAVNYFRDSAALSAYVLPRFVELNFGSDDLRLGFPLPVDGDRSTFESSHGRNHVDYAARLSGQFGDLESAISVFDGTLREPILRLDAASRTLRPHYQLGTQYGLETQYTRGATLFKFEGRYVNPDSLKSFENLVYGIEHVRGGVFGTSYELTLFAEHNWDSRGKDSPLPFQNDLFLGARLDFANTLGTTLRVGTYLDLDFGSLFGTMRLETRLNNKFSLQAVGYFAAEVDNQDDRLFTARDINQIQVALRWNF